MNLKGEFERRADISICSQLFLGPLLFQEQVKTTDTEETSLQTETEHGLFFLTPLTYLEGLSLGDHYCFIKLLIEIGHWGRLSPYFKENRDSVPLPITPAAQDQRSREMCVIPPFLFSPPANKLSLCTWQAVEEGGGEGCVKGRALHCLPRGIPQQTKSTQAKPRADA